MSGVRLVSAGGPLEGGHSDAAVLAETLRAAAIAVSAHVLVDDDEEALEAALDADGVMPVVASSGGSAGDSVRRVLARITGGRLRLDERMRRALEAHYARRDRPVPRSAERLALLPQGATIADAPAPVWTLERGTTTWIVFLRGGVAPALDAVLPFIRERCGTRGAVAVRTFKTVDAGAEEIEDRLADGFGAGDVSIATLPGDGEVWVRLRARGRTPAEALARLTEVEATIARRLGADCYGRDGDTLETVVGRLLRARNLTVAVAESCTGGLVGHRLTSVPESSAYFERGVIVYSSRAKEEMLGVDGEILRAHGAVSAQCAEAMVRGACARSGAVCGLSVTGVAGPDGGTPAKPVGTVFIGVALGNDVSARRFRFHGDRASVQWQSSVMALDVLRRKLDATR